MKSPDRVEHRYGKGEQAQQPSQEQLGQSRLECRPDVATEQPAKSERDTRFPTRKETGITR